MSKSYFTDEFKISAVEQVTARGHSVAEAAERLGVSALLIYSSKKQFSSSNWCALLGSRNYFESLLI